MFSNTNAINNIIWFYLSNYFSILIKDFLKLNYCNNDSLYFYKIFSFVILPLHVIGYFFVEKYLVKPLPINPLAPKIIIFSSII